MDGITPAHFRDMLVDLGAEFCENRPDAFIALRDIASSLL